MSDEREISSLMDAFVALDQIDDDDVIGMIKPRKKVHEGFDVRVFDQKGVKKAEATLQERKEETELEVIDPDATAIEMLKDNDAYIGNAILTCNKCQAPMFMAMDKLIASEDDSDVFNIETECPKCHSIGHGFSIQGQVGKVQREQKEQAEKEERETEAEVDIEQPEEESEEDSATAIKNDNKPEDEISFDNDLSAEDQEIEIEPDEESENDVEQETVKETPEVDSKLEDEEESDGMETNTSEDELDDLDLPALGDEYEEDIPEDNDKDDDKKELKEDLNEYASEAWLMNKVISSMNNDDAYYQGWLYIWPEGETEEQCAYDFCDRESLDELREIFINNYTAYHADGLFEPDAEAIEYAHKQDELLDLPPIDIIRSKHKEEIKESLSCSCAEDFFNSVIEPENIGKIIVEDVSGRNPRNVYNGSYEELPADINDSYFDSFNVDDGYLTCNIDTEDCSSCTNLETMLNHFNDEQSDKILIWDMASGDEVFSGTKADAIDKYGDCAFISFEVPAILRLNVCNGALSDTDEYEISDEDALVNNIIRANNLSPNRIDNENSTEYWINESIQHGEDLEMIYEKFVENTEDKSLARQFKQITGFKDELDAALAKYGKSLKDIEEDPIINDEPNLDENFNKNELSEFMRLCKQLNLNTLSDVNKFAAEHGNVKDQDLLVAMRKAEKDSRLDDFLTGPQIDELNPHSIRENRNKKRKQYSETLQKTYSFKTRRALAEAIEKCKNNNEPYTINRSLKEGYRYDLTIVKKLCEDNERSLTPLHHGDEVEGRIITLNRRERHMVNANMSDAEIDVLNRVRDVSQTIADAIKKYYDIDADPRLIVADILQDLRLISGAINVEDLENTPMNNATRQMFRSYEDFYNAVDSIVGVLTGQEIHTTREQKFIQALQILNSPAFEREAIEAGIASDRFLTAVENGAIPYLPANNVQRLREKLELKFCPKCGKFKCECKKKVDEADNEGEEEQADNKEEDKKDTETIEMNDEIEITNDMEDQNDEESSDSEQSEVDNIPDEPEQTSCVEETARNVMSAYQNANKWLDSVKECIYTNMNCPFFASFVHELAHTMPGRFDKFGDILHTINMEIPYPETAEIVNKPSTIQEAFNNIFEVLDAIKAALNEFIKCTDEEYHGMSCAAEALLNDIEEEYPMLFRLKAKAEECGDDTVTFDKFVAQYNEHKDSLLESLDNESNDVEFNSDKFDDEINKYFDEAYEETVLYHSTNSSIDKNGNVILEGVITGNEKDADVRFILTPQTALSEGVNIEENIKTNTYTVTNNLSDEKFEFSFDN